MSLLTLNLISFADGVNKLYLLAEILLRIFFHQNSLKYWSEILFLEVSLLYLDIIVNLASNKHLGRIQNCRRAERSKLLNIL